MTLPERIKAARIAAGLTQQEAAYRAGVTAQAWSHYERGRTLPRVDTLERLGGALGTTAAALLTQPVAAA